VYEIIALAVGAGIGMAAYQLDPRGRASLILAGGSLTGLAVSLLSGELEISPAFLIFDVGQVILAAVCAIALIEAVARVRDPS
jgi:hypothetical protein